MGLEQESNNKNLGTGKIMFHGISFSRYQTLVYTINVKKLVTKRKLSRIHNITANKRIIRKFQYI